MAAPPDNPAELSKQVRDSDAYRVYTRIDNLAFNYQVFEGNYHDINRLLVLFHDPQVYLKLTSVERRSELLTVLLDLSRRLLNFLTAALVLVDHTRNAVVKADWFSGTPFPEEYKRRVKQDFTQNRLHRFVQGLRNYSLHYRLPLTTVHTTVTSASDTGSGPPFKTEWAIVFSRDELLHSFRWKPEARAYLETAGENIDVEILVGQYFNVVRDFHIWMIRRLREIYANELAWLQDMHTRIQRAYGLAP